MTTEEKWTRAREEALDLVDNKLLRESVEQGPMNLSEIAMALGWKTPTGRPDTQRLARRLGKNSYYSRGGRLVSRTIKYDTAVLITRAANLDPVDVGI